jgi:hypothetical protein
VQMKSRASPKRETGDFDGAVFIRSHQRFLMRPDKLPNETNDKQFILFARMLTTFLRRLLKNQQIFI